MKKWKSPDFSMMNLSNTATVVKCDCGSNGLYNAARHPQHFCHVLGGWHDNNCASMKDEVHYQNDKCNNTPHWNGPNDSKCCCGQRVAGDTDNDIIINPS